MLGGLVRSLSVFSLFVTLAIGREFGSLVGALRDGSFSEASPLLPEGKVSSRLLARTIRKVIRLELFCFCRASCPSLRCRKRVARAPLLVSTPIGFL